MSLKNAKIDDEVPDIPDNLPCISIIIPFEPKMNSKSGFDYLVNAAAGKAEKELMKNYAEDAAAPVVKKMHEVLKNLRYKMNNKSIGIFVSPLSEKVYYFNYTAAIENNHKSTT